MFDLGELIEFQLIVAITVAATLMVRIVCGRWLGTAAYFCWIAVPVAFAIVVATDATSTTMLRPSFEISGPLRETGIAWANAQSSTKSSVVLTVWAIGVMAILLTWLLGHALLRRRLRAEPARHFGKFGPLVLIDPSNHTSAALIGVLRPKLVLAADFAERFDSAVQELILAHEWIHRRRFDPLWNAFAGLLVAVCWCNPIVWIAARRFRTDQELACDSAVVDRYPHLAVRYAHALIDVASHRVFAGVGCNWSDRRYTQERVTMIVSHKRVNRRTGAIAACLLASVIGYASASSKDIGASTYLVTISDELSDQKPKILTRADAKFSLSYEEAWELELQIDSIAGADVVRVHGTMHSLPSGELIASPDLSMTLGEDVRIGAGSTMLTLNVEKASPDAVKKMMADASKVD